MERDVQTSGAGRMRVSGTAALLLISFIMGFGLTLQIKSVYRNRAETQSADKARNEQLQRTVADQKSQIADLKQQLGDLRQSVSAYKSAAGKSGDTAKALGAQLARAELLAGLTDVAGKGVVVTMDDSKAASQSGVNPSAFVIHDTDVLQVLNELRDAGAEALSINDERVLATSEVRCAGNVLSINNARYSTPFVIRAIGDPDKLKSALLMRNGVADELSQWGITVSVQQSAGVRVKAYTGTPDAKYASPAKGGT